MNNEEPMTKIFLWGPTGSGKTWLLHSFIRTINLLDRVFENDIYKVRVQDEDGNTLNQKDLTYKPTISIDYQQDSYHREVNHPDYDPSLYNNHHTIGMLDGPGDETTGQVAIESYNNDSQALTRVQRAHDALKDADFLFVMIHPGKHRETKKNGETATDPNKAGQHFLERLEALHKIKRRKVTQQLFLCFTQADEYGGETGGLNAALRGLFGNKSDDIAYMLRQLDRSQQGLRLYFMSAVGYFPDPTENGKRKPNYNPGQQVLLRPDLWNPYKVAEPFFDVFDLAQENYLRSIGRPRDKWKQSLFDRIIVPGRLKLYKDISNRTMLHEGEKRIREMLY
jgi:hypothetical protein